MILAVCYDVTVISKIKQMDIQGIDRQAILNLELRLQHKYGDGDKNEATVGDWQKGRESAREVTTYSRR